MVQSFLNYFLPDDEYKRTRILYFMAEAAFLVTGILMFSSFVNQYWLNWELDGSIIGFLIAMCILCYTFLRYIFSGIEHTDIFNQKRYKKQCRETWKKVLISGLVFFIVSLAFSGIPSSWIEAMDLIGPSLLFMIFYYIVDSISLKRSYKKNKDLMDD